jgi:hypothetical protein
MRYLRNKLSPGYTAPAAACFFVVIPQRSGGICFCFVLAQPSEPHKTGGHLRECTGTPLHFGPGTSVTSPLRWKWLNFGFRVGPCRCFRIPISSSRPWECGNPKGISKECGKHGKPGFMAFHASHTLSFPWPALEARIKTRCSRNSRFPRMMGPCPHCRTRSHPRIDFTLAVNLQPTGSCPSGHDCGRKLMFSSHLANLKPT